MGLKDVSASVAVVLEPSYMVIMGHRFTIDNKAK